MKQGDACFYAQNVCDCNRYNWELIDPLENANRMAVGWLNYIKKKYFFGKTYNTFFSEIELPTDGRKVIT